MPRRFPAENPGLGWIVAGVLGTVHLIGETPGPEDHTTSAARCNFHRPTTHQPPLKKRICRFRPDPEEPASVDIDIFRDGGFHIAHFFH